MAQRLSRAIVSTEWLAGQLKAPNLRILDGSWHLPSAKRDPYGDYMKEHIPGAQFFDLDGCSDKTSPYSHMLPSVQQFEDYVGNLGISNDTQVIVYDNSDKFGLFSAQRVWWTFRVFGHDLVSVVDGGLNKWKAENRPITNTVDTVPKQVFKAYYKSQLVKNFEDMQSNLKDKKFTVLDARPQPRFEGKAPEPRPDIKPGHIPGAISLQFIDTLDPQTNTFKSPEELRKLFEDRKLDLSTPITASCGSGISACHVALAAFQCGKEDVAVYDGSWTEWFQRADDSQKANVPQD